MPLENSHLFSTNNLISGYFSPPFFMFYRADLMIWFMVEIVTLKW